MLSIGPNGEVYSPTIFPKKDFNAEVEAEKLHKAMKGFGCNKDAVNNILTGCNYQQRKQIERAFISLTGKDLIKELKSELSGNHEKLALLLFKSNSEINAAALKKAIRGIGTDEKTLCSILGTATNREILEIKEEYATLNKNSLEKDITGDCGGDFSRVLISLLQGQRKEPDAQALADIKTGKIENVIDRLLAKQQALELYEQGEKKIGTNETTFIKILCNQSVWQIAAIDYEYQQLAGHSIEKAINKELSGDFKKIMSTMLNSCLDRPAMYAELLYKTMKGVGTNDDELMRLIVTRSELDLGTIKETYLAKFSKTLAKDINGDTSGDYKKLLLLLIGEK